MKQSLRLMGLVLLLLILAGPAEGITAPQSEEIVYGTSGENRKLMAYRYGSGENVLVMGFAIHGYEDNFDQDGKTLVYTAEKLMEYLKGSYLPDAYNWTVYVLPCMNPDGLYSGWTNNGPGRCTTTYLDTSGNLVRGKGIDMNRCFPTWFSPKTNARNFTTSQPLASLEAKALSSFIQKAKGSGVNVLIDVHGWYEQTITTSSRILGVLKSTFPSNRVTNSNGGTGYLMNYAHTQGYESALLELPVGIYSMEQYKASGCVDRVIRSVEGILKTEPQVCQTQGHQYQTEQLPPTCTQAGYSRTVCAVCGDTISTTYAALGHSVDESSIEILSEPTASQPGLRKFGCTRCGHYDLTETIPSFFTDVNSEGYYAEALDYCYAEGYINGTTASTFGPNVTLSRAMLVTMLYRFEGEPAVEAQAPFADVAQGKYYAAAVNWAYSTGVINGITSTTFGPGEPVTRQQAMAIFFRYVRYLGLDNGKREDKTFSDSANLSAYAREAAQWSVANGIIQGDNYGQLLPRDATTRAQSVAILKRVAEYVAANGG